MKDLGAWAVNPRQIHVAAQAIASPMWSIWSKADLEELVMAAAEHRLCVCLCHLLVTNLGFLSKPPSLQPRGLLPEQYLCTSGRLEAHSLKSVPSVAQV